MPRGSKTCEKCGTVTGPRAYTCKNCGHSFNINKGASKRAKARKGIKFDWRELQPGDFIRVIAGSGPYWPSADGENVPMGYHGKFKVSEVTRDGIHAYPADKKNSGHCFIYMGPKRKSPIGMMSRPHKIRKLTKRPPITNPTMARNG